MAWKETRYSLQACVHVCMLAHMWKCIANDAARVQVTYLFVVRRRNALFIMQRHRMAEASTVGSRLGSVFTSLRRTIEGSAPSYRILLADYHGTVVAVDEVIASAEREWEFLEDRVVPQLQVVSVRYEDVLAVARGLFLASSLFDRPDSGMPLVSISAFVLKVWQICADLIPACKCWVRPVPARVTKSVYSELRSNEFFRLERNILPLKQWGQLLKALGAAEPTPAYRILINSKEPHVIARAHGQDELCEVRT